MEDPEDKIKHADKHKSYTRDIYQVIDSEKEYLRIRRQTLNERVDENKRKLPDEINQDNTWGLCISGGGIRSATLGLGMMQALMKNNLFRLFDYMSTVSGGGYIGSCLSSMLSNEYQEVNKFEKTNPNAKEVTDAITAKERAEGIRMVRYDKFKPEKLGVDADDSPFVGHRGLAGKEYTRSKYSAFEKLSLNVRDQLHHFRRNGEYLTPDKGLFSWDVMRLVGTLFAGVWHHFLLFFLFLIIVISGYYLIFQFISGGEYPSVIFNGNSDQYPITAIVTYWIEEVMKKPVTEIFKTLSYYIVLPIGLIIIGFIFEVWMVYKVEDQVKVIKNDLEREKAGEKTEADEDIQRFAGSDLERHFSSPMIGKLFLPGLFLAPTISIILALIFQIFDIWNFSSRDGYWLLFVLPFTLNLGMVLGALFAIPVRDRRWKFGYGRIFRSFYSGIQGASFYGLLISILIPIGILTLFSTFFDRRLIIALITVGVNYKIASYFIGKSGMMNKIAKVLLKPLLYLSILLFVAMSFSAIFSLMMELELTVPASARGVFLGEAYVNLYALYILLTAAICFIMLGYLSNSNKLSMHYFYRYRLTEAFLKTDAMIERPMSDGHRQQGTPLVNVRNHDNLRLYQTGDIGEGKNVKHIAPYHIIIGAINLSGSNDLMRRRMKSEHFLFTRNYIGSKSTGYVKSKEFAKGEVKLATAMTISGAAVSSQMGGMTFAAQAFFMTLFNLRTGYWLDNPWFYSEENAPRHPSKVHRLFLRMGEWIHKDWTFWPYYLFQELMGKVSARERRVNVSDGGFTGDNLGLIPLLQRRCNRIVVCDFEEDGGYQFGSLNHAIRMANVELDVQIEINLDPLLPKIVEGQNYSLSEKSVVLGRISYPKTERYAATEGLLIYLKSSVSKRNVEEAIKEENFEDIPVSALNFLKAHPDFPHQSTADQFFDIAQFEAHRTMGKHIGMEAAHYIKKAWKDNSLEMKIDVPKNDPDVKN